MNKIALVIALALASLNSAQAQTEASAPKQMRFLVGAGLTFGGDKLATASYENGAEIDIRAGSMLAITTGIDYRVTDAFSFQATVGYHVDNAPARNGDIRFQRFPMELLAYGHAGTQWRFGGGVRYVSNPKLSSSGAGYVRDYEFDNTVGAVAEAEYLMTPHIGFKLRYVSERYEVNGRSDKIKGNHVGLMANYYF